MNNKDLKKMLTKENIASKIIMHAIPIDFAKLIKDGVMKKIGKSYYSNNIKKLPDHVAIKIRSMAETEHGIRLTFYNATKTDIKKAEELKKLGYK